MPFDLDNYDQGVGKAPAALIQAGLVPCLAARGVKVVSQETISPELSGGGQLTRLGRLGKQVADLTAAARASDTLPVILGGDCLNAVAVCAGLQTAAVDQALGIAWFDAHGDFNTPDTTLSGYLGGMPLACLCGYGLEELRASAGLEHPVEVNHVIMLGVRDLDPAEKELLESTPISCLNPAQVAAGRTQVAAGYHFQEVDGAYLHFDLDALDPGTAPGVDYPAPGGLSLEAAVSASKMVRAAAPLAGVTLSAFNPAKDRDDKTIESAIHVLAGILGE